MIIVDGIMYLGLSPKRYIEYDLSDPNSPLGTDLTDQLDPGQMVDVFEEGVTDARYLGEDEKQGVPLERYRITVDPKVVFDTIRFAGGGTALGGGDAARPADRRRGGRGPDPHRRVRRARFDCGRRRGSGSHGARDRRPAGLAALGVHPGAWQSTATSTRRPGSPMPRPPARTSISASRAAGLRAGQDGGSQRMA